MTLPLEPKFAFVPLLVETLVVLPAPLVDLVFPWAVVTVFPPPLAPPAEADLAPPAVLPLAPPVEAVLAPPAVVPLAAPAVVVLAPPAVVGLAPPPGVVLPPPAVVVLAPPAVVVLAPPAVVVLAPPAVVVFAPPAVVVLAPPAVVACEPPVVVFAPPVFAWGAAPLDLGADACCAGADAWPPPPEDLFFWPQAKLGTMSKIKNTIHFPENLLPEWANFILNLLFLELRSSASLPKTSNT